MDPDKTVQENVEEAVGPPGASSPVRRNQRPARRAARGEDEMDKAARRAGPRARSDRNPQRLGARPADRDRDGCDESAPGRGRSDETLWRRAAAGRAVQDSAGAARSAAARRAHEPSRRRVDQLARTPPVGISRHGGRRDARCYFLDNVAGWILEIDRGRGIPCKGITPRGSSRSGTGWRRKNADVGPPKDAGPRAGMDSHGSQGPASEKQGPTQRLRTDEEPKNIWTRKRNSKFRFRPASRSGNWSSRPRKISKAYGDQVLFENLLFACRPAASWASSAPTGRAKRRCSG